MQGVGKAASKRNLTNRPSRLPPTSPTKLSTMPTRPSEKGAEIRFVKGVYKGEKGWLDKSKKQKKKVMHSVGVDMEDDNGQKVVKWTRVRANSYRKKFSAPKSYEEAAVQQHFKIEAAMIELAELFATCAVYSQENCVDLFAEELQVACEYQEKLGVKAKWRRVRMPGPNGQQNKRSHNDPNRMTN